MYNTEYSDEAYKRGFINKELILKRVKQEEIFKLVFGYEPEEFEQVTSPFRKDKNAGCWFEYHLDKLRFVDFGNTNVHYGIKMSNIDCFDAVQVYFNIPNFYLTLQYINRQLILNCPNYRKPLMIKTEATERKSVRILIESRPYYQVDANFWSQYKISKANLIEDKVFAIKKFYVLNSKTGTYIKDCTKISYSYNGFEQGRKKLYFPTEEGRKRFITNCGKDDVGGLNKVSAYSNQLIITKSYKDYRVLKNQNKNVIWLQNEGMIPTSKNFYEILSRYPNIIVWFDNDRAGIEAVGKVSTHLRQQLSSKITELWFPESLLEKGIKDPSDCIKNDPEFFYQFLKANT